MSTESQAGSPSEPTTYNLLFVCTGNTCRSPLAEAAAAAAIARRDWPHVRAASAGTAAVDGAPASVSALEVAAEHGLDLSNHRSRSLTPELLDWADLILAMSASHLMTVSSAGASEKAAMLTDFLEGDGLGEPVEDPFGGDLDTYRRAYARIADAMDGLFARLEPILSP
jgi:protein-tyrosine-phosphatase